MPTKDIPPPPTDGGGEPPWSKDDKARKESELWPNEDSLKGRRRKNEANLLWLFGWLTPILVVVFSLLFVVSLIVWTIHQVTPICFLTADQLSKIQSVIFSGTLGAIVSSLAGPYFKKPDREGD